MGNKESDPLNVIFIMNDTLRQDHLGCYGNRWIKTPNLDRLAESSTVFDRAYVASHATLPARTDLYTGTYSFLYRGWSPLQHQDVILPEIIGHQGYTSMFIFDTTPMGQDSYNYMRGFSGWEMIRGHHEDRWRTDPTVPIEWPAAPHKLKNLDRSIQYMRNRADWRHEKDYVAPRTFAAAIEWLERNHTLDGFLLWIDTWDPHEPFDPPAHDLKLYADPEYDGDQITYPQYGRSTYMTKEELRHVRALYAGEVTMVDRWIGHLMDKVEQLGLLDNTLIIHTSDHGHLFGEHDLEGKPGGVLGRLYEVTTRLPLIIRHPGGLGAGRRIQSIVQPPDVLPTILEFLDVPMPETNQGQSVWPLVKGKTDRLHDYAFSGRFARCLSRREAGKSSETVTTYDGFIGPGDVAEDITVTDEDWSLILSPRGRPSELYNLKGDPGQHENVIKDHMNVASTMQSALIAFMREYGGSDALIDLYSVAPEGMVAPKDDSAKRLRPRDAVFLTHDQRGTPIAFLSKREAAERCASAVDDLVLEARSFGWLRDRNPRSLIYVDGQYYWAEDLG